MEQGGEETELSCVGEGKGRRNLQEEIDEVSLLGEERDTPCASCGACGVRRLSRGERFLLKACCVVGGGGFVFGYNIGVMSGALAQLENEFSLSSVESGIVMSALALGSVLGCVIGGPMCDSLGRWKTIQGQNVMFLFGAVLSAVAPSFVCVVIGRIMVGVGSSISAIADIPYLQEISPPSMRGRISSSYEMLVVIGVLISFAVDVMLNDASPEAGWRYMFALPVPAILMQIFGMLSLPESPKYLLDKGYEMEAKKTILITLDLYQPKEISTKRVSDSSSYGSVERYSEFYTEGLLNDILLDMKLMDRKHNLCETDESDHKSSASCESLEGNEKPTSTKQTSSEKLSSRSNNNESALKYQYDRVKRNKMKSSYSRLNTDVADTELQSPELVSTTSNQSEITSAKNHNTNVNVTDFWDYRKPLIVVLILMVFQQFTGGLVVRNYAPKIFGAAGFSYRKSLLFNLGLGIMKVLSTGVAIYFVDTFGRKPLLLSGVVITSAGMLMLVLSFATEGLKNNVGIFLCAGLLITAGYSLGFGPVCWVAQSEYFPTSIRGRCMALSVLVSNLGQFIMTLAFPPLMTSVDPSWIFLSFFLMCVLALLFVTLIVVETKGKHPKQILDAFSSV